MAYYTHEEPRAQASADQAFLTKVYGWMFLGLAMTAVVAWSTNAIPALRDMVTKNPPIFFGLLIAEVLLVVAISAGINKMSASVATALFGLYAAINGLTLSFLFMIYTPGSITAAFVTTSATFGAISLYGFVTKRDLSKIGSLCMMALFGIIIASIVNFFMDSRALDQIITYAGVLIFVGLTAYDTQKIKNMAAQAGNYDGETMQKAAVIGALHLYLDFINLLIFILRIMGRRR
jgi:uncharacterized protein